MNIKRAKEEIKHTVQAYLQKDEFGNYKIPPVNQRPILLIGPPELERRRLWNRRQEKVK